MRRSWSASNGPSTEQASVTVDLIDPAGIILLRRLDATYATSHLPLPELEIVALPREPTDRLSLMLLPGGALALHGPDQSLVCDPQSCVVFSHDQLGTLHVAVGGAEQLTIGHLAGGVGIASGAQREPVQAVTIIAAALCLAPVRAVCATWPGPALLRWHGDGAVAWPLVVAPACLDLVASLVGRPLLDLDCDAFAAGRLRPAEICHQPAELWQAATAEARFRTTSLRVAEATETLLALDLSDRLRQAVVAACSDGEASLAARLADALGLLPACFDPDPTVAIGTAAPPPWPPTLAAAIGQGRALLGLAPTGTAAQTIAALRGMPETAGAMLFRPGDAEVPLTSDAALFLARRRAGDPTLGLRLPLPSDPVALYSLADRIARRLATPVLAIAPGWGFCHQADPTGGREFGNAAWFGLGLDLDELDDACLL